MALKVGELFATMNLNDDGFSSGLKKAKESAGNVVGDIIKTLGLVTLGKSAFTAFTDFESAFAGVMKTVDETATKTYADLEASIIAMSKELPASAVEIAAVAEAAGQLGIGADDVEAFTRVMIDLGESTNMTADDAATTLAKFANIMGTSANEYSNLGSAIVALGNNYATTEADIAAMAIRMAGTGSQLKMSEADIFGFSAAISSIGMESQAGGSAFSSFASNLSLAVSQGGKDLKAYAKVAGMSSKDFKKMFKEDATGAILAFIEGLGKSEDAIKVLDKLGISEINQQKLLLGAANSSEMFAGAIDDANAAYKENTALSEEAAKRYATLESRIAMLKNQGVEMARQFGAVMAPAIEVVMALASALIETITNLSAPIKTAIVAVGAFAAAMGPAKLIIASLVKLLAAGIGTALGPIGLLAAGAALLYKTCKPLRNVIKKLSNMVATFAKGLKAGLKPLSAIRFAIHDAFGKNALPAIDAAAQAVRDTWGAAIGWVKTLLDGMKGAFSTGAASGGVFSGILESAKFAGGNIGDLLRKGWNAAKNTVTKITSSVATTLKERLIPAIAGVNWSGIWDSVVITYDGIKEKIVGFVAKIPEWFNELVGDAKEFIEGGKMHAIGESMVNLIGQGISMYVSGKARLVEAITGIISGINWEEFADFVSSAGAILVDGLVAAIKGVATGGAQIIMALGSLLENIPWEPLGVTVKAIGGVIVDGIVRGIKAVVNGATLIIGAVSEVLGGVNWSEIGSFLTSIGQVVITAIVDGLKAVVTGGAQIFAAIAEMFKKIEWADMGAAAGDIVTSLITALTTALTGEGEDAIDFEGFVENLATGIGNAVAGLATAASTLVGTLIDYLTTGDNFANLLAAGGAILEGIVKGIIKGALNISDTVGAALEKGTIDAANEGFHVDWSADEWSEKEAQGLAKRIIDPMTGHTVMWTLSVDAIEVDTSNAEVGFGGGRKGGGGGAGIPEVVDGGSSGPIVITPDGIEYDLTDAEVTFAAADVLAESAIEAAKTLAASKGTEIGVELDENTAAALRESPFVGEAAVEMVDSIVASMEASLAGIVSVGKQMSFGLAVGILSGKSLVIAAATLVAKAAITAAKVALDINSPSRVTTWFGEMFDGGLVDGMLGSVKGVANAARYVAQSATQAMAMPQGFGRVSVAASGAGSQSVMPIDYDRLAEAMDARRITLEMDGRELAHMQSGRNAVAAAERSKSIASGYGRRS